MGDGDLYGAYSFWLETAGDLTPRPPLPGDRSVDVAIVGAGFTGLWTAYYLAKADPSLRIAVIERDVAGFGASGRNGGWCLGLFAAPNEKIAAEHGRSGALAMRRVMFDTVDEIGRVCAEESIAADFAKGGSLTVATTPPQRDRVRALVSSDHDLGLTDAEVAWLEPGEAAERIEVEGCLGASFTPHCAALHPARLARGLARVVEGLGVNVFERTAASSIEPGRVVTDRGTVRADVVVRATEGYTPTLRGGRRVLLPLHIFMIATEPLPRSFWNAVGWRERETLADAPNAFVYAQRTADDRIALGGRSIHYGFGSRTRDEPGCPRAIADEMRRALVQLFPAASDARITHSWGGFIGVPRDWYPSAGFDSASRIAWAGGYVGDGVSTSNLGGRTLRDLILGRDTELTRLPWVGHSSRDWEPEPLRWLGTRLSVAAMRRTDRVEARTGRTSRLGEAARRFLGM